MWDGWKLAGRVWDGWKLAAWEVRKCLGGGWKRGGRRVADGGWTLAGREVADCVWDRWKVSGGRWLSGCGISRSWLGRGQADGMLRTQLVGSASLVISKYF